MAGPATQATTMDSPPAIVINLTDAQLEALRGDSALPFGETGKDQFRQMIAMAASDQPEQPATTPVRTPTPQPPVSATHDPFGLNRQNQELGNEARDAKAAPAVRYQLPPAIVDLYKHLDDQKAKELGRDMFIASGRAYAGLAEQNYDNVLKLKALPADQVEQAVTHYMEIKLGEVPPGGVLAGVTPEQTATLKLLRAQYNRSGVENNGKTQADIDAIHAQYKDLCYAYMIGDFHGVHEVLLKKAFEGFEAGKVAQKLYDTVHDTSLTTEQRREELIKATANVPKEHFAAVMSEYAAIPEREAGERLYKAIAAGDMKTMHAMLDTRSSLEAQNLMAFATAYALDHKTPDGKPAPLPLPGSVGKEYADVDKRHEFEQVIRGFDAKTQGAKAYLGYDHTLGAKDAEIAAAFGAPNADKTGKRVSIYSAEQIAQIRTELAQQAASLSGETDQAKKDAAVKEVMDRCNKVISKIEPSTVTPPPVVANFRADLSKYAGVNADQDMKAVSASITYGYDAPLAATMLDHALRNYDQTDPNADPSTIIRLLQKGSDPSRMNYYTKDELVIVVQAFDQMLQSPAGDRNLRTEVSAKLTGDARVQALQAIDEGFFAPERAEAISRDLNEILRIGEGAKTKQQLLDRIDQTDKEYKKSHAGQSLAEAVQASSLPQAEKDKLYNIAVLPAIVGLHDELAKAKPDPTVIAKAIDLKDAERIYAAMYPAKNAFEITNLRVNLEELGRQGKLTRDFVLEQELKLEGLPLDTFAKLDKELDPNAPTIGTKQSVLTGLTTAQISFVDHGFSYAQEGRAIARGEGAYKNLSYTILELSDQQKISTPQFVRASLTLSGRNPWQLVDSIDKDRLTTLTTLKELDPVQVAVVRDLYKEEKGKLLLGTLLTDPAMEKGFGTQTEYLQWTDQVADRLYGEGVRDIVSTIASTVDEVQKPDLTPEQKAELVTKLSDTIHAVASWSAMPNTAEMYDAYFRKDKAPPALTADLDKLADAKILTPEQAAELKALVSPPAP